MTDDPMTDDEARRPDVQTFDDHYIDGQWVTAGSDERIDVFDSTTEEVMARVPAGTAADVDAAVAAARAAFSGWAATPVDERAKYLTRIGDALGARMDELATTISKETGMAKWLSQLVQVGLPINSFNHAASIASQFAFEEEVGNSLVVREPIGVVGCITPWNYPLHQIAAKVAYAMAAGCTVVLKPSEVAPLDAFVLAEVIHEVGLPAGVFNLVCRDGAGGRRGHRRAPGRGHGDLHGLDPGRASRRRARRRVHQEGDAGAGREVGQRAARRPRRGHVRPRREGRCRQGLPQLRPDVLRPHPHAGPTGSPR